MALRILLVDDDPHIRGHLAALLGDFPNVIVAGSPARVLRPITEEDDRVYDKTKLVSEELKRKYLNG